MFFAVYQTPLTEEEQKMVDALEKKIDFPLPPYFQESLQTSKQMFLAKFLVARKWNVSDAYDMMKATAAFRIENKLETRPLFPPVVPVRGYDIEQVIKFENKGIRLTNERADEVYAKLNCCYVAAWHKCDKAGRPVYIERTGKIRSRLLEKRCMSLVPPGGDMAEPVRAFHLHSNEVGAALTRYRNANLPAGANPVSQITVIMDCDGMSMDTFYGPALDLLQANSKMDQAYYPECLHRLYMVNAPTVVKVGWSIAKRWLDKRVQKKVFFCSPGEETKKALLEYFNPADLPAFLGGQCSCKGGCVPELEAAADSDTTGTEQFTIKSSGKDRRVVPLKAGETGAWEFITMERHIVFSVKFMPETPSAAVGATVDVVNPDKISKHTGSYKAPSNGTLHLMFDNEYSWMREKVLRLRTQVIDTSHLEEKDDVGSPTEYAHFSLTEEEAKKSEP